MAAQFDLTRYVKSLERVASLRLEELERKVAELERDATDLDPELRRLEARIRSLELANQGGTER